MCYNANMKSKAVISKIFTHLGVMAILFLPMIVLAQGSGGYIGIKNPATSVNSISDIVTAVVRVVRMVAIPFVVLAIIYSGWLFIAAQGNPDKLKSARGVFFWTLIGTLVVLSAELVASILAGLFNQKI